MPLLSGHRIISWYRTPWCALWNRTFSHAAHTEFFRRLGVQNSGYRQFVGFLKIPQSLLRLAIQGAVDGTRIQSFCFEGFLCFLDVVAGNNHPFVASAWSFDPFRDSAWFSRHWFALGNTRRRLARYGWLRWSRLRPGRSRPTSRSALSEQRACS